MKLNNLFSNKENLYKILIITISIIFWMYFYVVSKAELYSVIILDIPTIINTFFSTSFILFLILLPLTTIIISVFSLKDNLDDLIFQTTLSVFISIIFSLIFFKISLIFVLFLFLYLIIHIILIVLTKKKQNTTKKSFDIINFVASKATLFFCVILFISIFLTVAPNQEENAVHMEAGLINLFVGDDMTDWFGMSYSLQGVCTIQNYDHVISSQQFRELKQNTDSKSVVFVAFIENQYDDLLNNRKNKIRDSLPDLTSIELKEEILSTIDEIPLMKYVKQYFAIIYAIFIVSFVYIYFAFAFSVLGLLYFYLFFILFKNKKTFVKENIEYQDKEEQKPEENTPEEIEDTSSLEESLSQKKGPRSPF
jgi:hypothetical protein